MIASGQSWSNLDSRTEVPGQVEELVLAKSTCLSVKSTDYAKFSANPIEIWIIMVQLLK